MSKLFLNTSLALAATFCFLSSAQAGYYDLQPQTYHEYFVHLTDNESPWYAQEGDVVYEDHEGEILTPPLNACGMRFEDVRSVWYAGNSTGYTEGPGPVDVVVVNLPIPGCGNNGVEIELGTKTSNGVNFSGISLQAGAIEFVAQAYITYWIDENGNGFGGCGQSACTYSAINELGIEPKPKYLTLDSELDDASGALRRSDKDEALFFVSSALIDLDVFDQDVNVAIQNRRADDLGVLEQSVQDLEDSAMQTLSDAKNALEDCSIALKRNRLDLARAACDDGIDLYRSAQHKLVGAHKLVAEDSL
jgi:hypothetical protein